MRRDQNAIRHCRWKLRKYSSMHLPPVRCQRGNGERLEASQVKAPTISHAWIEFGNVTISSSYGELFANTTVPLSPSTNDGQTVSLFPGVENINDVVTIIQPVLAWNDDYAGEGASLAGMAATAVLSGKARP